MPAVRVLHTADLHLDASFAGEALPPEMGKQCRLAQRDTLRVILERAQSWPADALLIAGDLFDGVHVSRDTLNFLQKSFAAVAPLPVYISPGKADPFTPNAPYAQEAWPANVTIFRQGQWERHDLPEIPLSVHGFACTGDTATHNPFVDFQVTKEERLQIGLVYAAEQSDDPPEHAGQILFNRSGVENCGLDYLALGCAHEQETLQLEGSTVASYPGAPHGLGFKARTSGQFLEVEIEAGTSPTIRPVPVNTLLFDEQALNVSNSNNLKDLMESLEPLLTASDAAAMALLRLTFYGEVDWLLSATLPIVRGRLRERLHWLDFIDDVDTGPWYQATTDPNTTAGAFVLRMSREIQDAPDAETRRKLMHARSLGMAAFRGESPSLEAPGGLVI